MIELVLEK